MKRKSVSDIVVNTVAVAGILLVNVVMLYPFIYTVSVSFSKAEFVVAGMVKLWPVGVNLFAYKTAFAEPLLGSGYLNTILYASVGTALTLIITLITAYPLCVKNFHGKRAFVIYMAITMYFSGGLIPYFLLIQNLKLMNTIWAMILPCISVWYIIICRTYFQANIPIEMRESALIDGANDLRILFQIYLPLSLPIIATIGLWCVVAYWNSWFNALLFLKDQNLYPLQMVVRKTLILFNPSSRMRGMMMAYRPYGVNEQTVRCAIIIITILPIIMIYPFIQKYFVKGVMVGALKG